MVTNVKTLNIYVIIYQKHMIYQFQYIEKNTLKCRKKYKKYYPGQKRTACKNEVNKLQNLMYQNPNEYWKMWKQLKANRNTNNVDITTRQFYETFLRQSQPPALDMFDTHFMSTISNAVTNNNLSYNHDKHEAKDCFLSIFWTKK